MTCNQDYTRLESLMRLSERNRRLVLLVIPPHVLISRTDDAVTSKRVSFPLSHTNFFFLKVLNYFLLKFTKILTRTCKKKPQDTIEDFLQNLQLRGVKFSTPNCQEEMKGEKNSSPILNSRQFSS